MSIRKFTRAISAVALVLSCGAALACPTCPDDLSAPNNNSGSQTNASAGPAANNAATTANIVSDISGGGGTGLVGLQYKRYALGGTGAAAAPGGKQWNVWGAFSRSSIAYEFAPLNSSGQVNVYLGGIDYTFSNNVVLGVATAFDRTDIDQNAVAGTLKGEGVTVSPYLAVLINKNFSFDATLGYGRTHVDTAVPVAGVLVVGSTRSDRNLATLGMTYRATAGAWTFTGRGALLHVHDKLGAYTLSNGTFVADGTVNLTQARLTGMVAYTSGPVTPYVSLSYINDIRRPNQAPIGGVAAANDRDAWTPAVGIRFRADNSFYGSVQYSTERGRSEVRNNQFLINAGFRF